MSNEYGMAYAFSLYIYINNYMISSDAGSIKYIHV